MRAKIHALAVLAIGLFIGCASKTEEGTSKPSPESKSGTAQTANAAIQALIGGQLVAVADHHVEVKVFKSGLVQALVLNPRGEPIDDPEKAQVVVRPSAKGEKKPEARLAWVPAEGRFQGDLAKDPGSAERKADGPDKATEKPERKADLAGKGEAKDEAKGEAEAEAAARAEAELELTPGPVEVELSLGGKKNTGRLEGAVLLVGPELGGALVVAGKLGVELVAGADGTVEALVHDAAGVRVTGDADAKLEVKLMANGKLQAIALAWNAARARFVGKLEAGAKLEAGPAEIALAGKVEARLPRLALSARAEHGGRVILVGNYSVELVAKGGVVSAFVFDANGKAYVKGDLDLSLRTAAGAFVKLEWDAPSLSYKAKLDLDLDVQPVTLALKAEGKVSVGARVPSVRLAADAKLDAKAKAEAKANAKLDAKAAAGAKAKLNAPKISVTAPKVEVKKSASAGASAGTGAKAKASFSLGTK